MADGMQFEWDPRKAASNLVKHKVSFELATLVFDDPLVWEFEEGTEHGEARYRALGKVGSQLLFVAYTSFEEDGEEIIRIISARKAKPQERRAFERHTQTYS